MYARHSQYRWPSIRCSSTAFPKEIGKSSPARSGAGPVRSPVEGDPSRAGGADTGFEREYDRQVAQLTRWRPSRALRFPSTSFPLRAICVFREEGGRHTRYFIAPRKDFQLSVQCMSNPADMMSPDGALSIFA